MWLLVFVTNYGTHNRQLKNMKSSNVEMVYFEQKRTHKRLSVGNGTRSHCACSATECLQIAFQRIVIKIIYIFINSFRLVRCSREQTICAGYTYKIFSWKCVCTHIGGLFCLCECISFEHRHLQSFGAIRSDIYKPPDTDPVYTHSLAIVSAASEKYEESQQQQQQQSPLNTLISAACWRIATCECRILFVLHQCSRSYTIEKAYMLVLERKRRR